MKKDKKLPDNIVYDENTQKFDANIKQYPTTVGGQKFEVLQVDKSDALKADKYFNKRLTELKEEWDKLVGEYESTKLIYETTYTFQPLLGEIYHIYKGNNDNTFLSLINPNEWDREVPKVLGDDRRYGHGICATNAILYQGKKALIIEDSWGVNVGINGRRIVTQDWFDARKIVYAGYYKFLKNDGLPNQPKPQHFFKRDLYYGMKRDPEVMILQECLAHLKFFPNDVDFTGNFYNITRNAVKAFQSAHGIDPVKGFVGPITRSKLNNLFA